MDERTAQLTSCFRTVFPRLPEAQIPAASTETLADWDSIASMRLAAVIEEAFQIELDLEALDQLTSFAALQAYLEERSARP